MASEADAVIYLEADEEITSVIDKLKRSKSQIVGVVAPRNAVLLQSIVNLKLLKKEADKSGKSVALVTADTVGQNLALRTGLTVYGNIHDTEPIAVPEIAKPRDTIEMDESDKVPESETMTGGFKVHHYRSEEEEAADKKIEEVEPETTELVKNTVKEKTVGQLQEEAETNADEVDDNQVANEEPAFTSKKIHTEEPIVISVNGDQDADDDTEEKPEPKKSFPEKGLQRDWQPSGKIPASAGTFRKKWWHQKHVITAIFMIALLSGGGAFAATRSMPQVHIALTIEANSLAKNFSAKVSKNQTGVNTDELTIPGRLLSSSQEITKKITATGKKNIGVKATGTITVYNETGTDYSFEAGSAFRSSTGFLFRSNNAFTVPKATLNAEGDKLNGSTSVDVSANNPGEDYNIDATSYSIGDYSKIYGEGGSMSGGSTREITVISKSDVNTNAKAMAKDLYAKALTDLKKQAGSDIFNEQGIENQMVDSDPSVAIGTEVADFNLKVSTKSSILVYGEDNLTELSKNVIEKDTPEGTTMLPNSVQATAEEGKVNLSNGTMSLEVQALGYYGTAVDEDNIKESLYGKNTLEAEATLKTLPSVKTVEITFSPAWWVKKIPKDGNKISMAIDYSPASNAATNSNLNTNSNANANSNQNSNYNTNGNSNSNLNLNTNSNSNTNQNSNDNLDTNDNSNMNSNSDGN